MVKLLRGTVMVAGGTLLAFAFMAVLPVILLEIDTHIGPDPDWPYV